MVVRVTHKARDPRRAYCSGHWELTCGQHLFTIGSDLGPITSEYGRKPWYKTQSRLKRANHIA